MGLEDRINRTEKKTKSDMCYLINLERNGRSAQSIADEYDPTFGSGDRSRAFNLTAKSTLGPVDVDWMLLLINKSNDTFWPFDVEDTYDIGKSFWTVGDAVSDRSWEVFKGHIKEFHGVEESNAIEIAKRIASGMSKLEDFFPEYVGQSNGKCNSSPQKSRILRQIGRMESTL